MKNILIAGALSLVLVAPLIPTAVYASSLDNYQIQAVTGLLTSFGASTKTVYVIDYFLRNDTFPPLPTCTLSFSPTVIAPYPAPTSILTWASTNATEGRISYPGNNFLVSPNGFFNSAFLAQVTTTYTGTFVNPVGTTTCSATLVVVQPSSPVRSGGGIQL